MCMKNGDSPFVNTEHLGNFVIHEWAKPLNLSATSPVLVQITLKFVILSNTQITNATSCKPRNRDFPDLTIAQNAFSVHYSKEQHCGLAHFRRQKSIYLKFYMSKCENLYM